MEEIGTVERDAEEKASPTPTAEVPSEGKWLLVTESSSYLVDFDEKTVTRSPGKGGGAILLDPPPAVAELRKDGQPIRLIDFGGVEIGKSVVMALDLMDDGFVTPRITTLAHSFTRLQ